MFRFYCNNSSVFFITTVPIEQRKVSIYPYIKSFTTASDFAMSSVRMVTAEEAQAALVDYAAGQCCWGKGAAAGMVITDIKHVPVFHVSIGIKHLFCLCS